MDKQGADPEFSNRGAQNMCTHRISYKSKATAGVEGPGSSRVSDALSCSLPHFETFSTKLDKSKQTIIVAQNIKGGGGLLRPAWIRHWLVWADCQILLFRCYGGCSVKNWGYSICSMYRKSTSFRHFKQCNQLSNLICQNCDGSIKILLDAGNQQHAV